MAARTRSPRDRLVQNLKPVAYLWQTLRGRFANRPYMGIALTTLSVLCGVGADAAVAFVADFAEGLWIGLGEAVEHTVQRFAHGLDGRGGVVVGAAEGFGDDLVDDPASLHVRRRKLERFGGLGGPSRVAEDYGGACFGRYDGEVGVLEHTDVVCCAHGERPARTPLPDNYRDHRHRYFGQCHQIGGDGPGLSPLLRTTSGKGAGRVDEHDHGQPEPGGEFVEALDL